jgi:hypothetical protein
VSAKLPRLRHLGTFVLQGESSYLLAQPGKYLHTMPTVSSSQLDPPKSWDELEEICADLFAVEWGDRNTVRHGRQGQRQNGVDIYGRPRDGGHAGVQCKGKRRWPPTNLTVQEIDDEVAEALKFRPALTEYIIATTWLDDTHLQEHARRITALHHAQGLFSVHIFGWGELSRRIAGHEPLIQKHYSYTSLGAVRDNVAALASKVEDIPTRLLEQLRAVGLIAETGAAADALSAEYNRELDSFRDIADRGQPRTALDLLRGFEARVWKTLQDRSATEFSRSALTAMMRLTSGRKRNACSARRRHSIRVDQRRALMRLMRRCFAVTALMRAPGLKRSCATAERSTPLLQRS